MNGIRNALAIKERDLNNFPISHRVRSTPSWLAVLLAGRGRRALKIGLRCK